MSGDNKTPWDPRLVLGFVMVVMLFILSESIALGEVKEESSFGLGQLLGTWQALVVGFTTWAYVNYNKDGNGKGGPPAPPSGQGSEYRADRSDVLQARPLAAAIDAMLSVAIAFVTPGGCGFGVAREVLDT